METYLLWDCLKIKDQEKLRSLMPVGWVPPSYPTIAVSAKLEDIEEIERLMKMRPRYPRGGSSI